VTIGGLPLAGLIAYSGTYGLNHHLLRRQTMVWVAANPDDSRLSPAMRLALGAHPPDVMAGAFAWARIDKGFEVGELPVLADGAEVERILLARVDPAHFKFQVWNRPSGDRDAQDWLSHLGAALIINGSYYSRYGTPATPILSARVPSGPATYDARHGAFVASPHYVGIRDLARISWQEALRGADDAMVSYPLLIGDDGESRSRGDPRWLANRSFVAQDGDGRIVLGTTADAFFSLDRLAAFLRAAPLGLKLALNLDGGPIACQAIALKDFRRDVCGRWETASDDGKLRVLTPLFGHRNLGLPLVLAVLPR
jgi:phosphodiester glycosidase